MEADDAPKGGGPKCKTCEHPDREAIEQALINRKSQRAVGKQFGISHTAIQRHVDRHMSRDMAAAIQAKDAERGEVLLDRLDELDQAVDEVLQRARENHENRLILAAVKEARANVELRGKMTGDVPSDNGSEEARMALTDPETRQMLADLEERLA